MCLSHWRDRLAAQHIAAGIYLLFTHLIQSLRLTPSLFATMASLLDPHVLLLWSHLLTVTPFSLASFELAKTKASNEERWRTDDQNDWTGICADGNNQSPVDLALSAAELVNYDRITFNNYHLTGPVFVDNSSGHSGTVEGFFKWGLPPSISGGNLKTTYFLRQLHFHWNSEHTFNGLHYPAELHLVHISDRYDPTLNMSLSGKVAVIAIPFQVGDSDAGLYGIDDLLIAVNSIDSGKATASISPSVLLPMDTKTFFRYSGSLTTPPCTEGVTWTVLSEPVILSAEQLAALKGPHTHVDIEEVRNSRPIQPMKGRKLYLNKGGRTFLEEDALSKVLYIFSLLILLMVAPPLLILWVIYKKTTLPNSNASTISGDDSETETAREEELGFMRAELEVPLEEPALQNPSQQPANPSNGRRESSLGRQIYECLCVSPEESVLPYHGE
ncbi:hypothetical protein RB195_005548 [Necator americanus]|uniref:Alpha-carbonic anhydrase domain-containing protein n=1 Tax=Necator americanus TaxID=51031 RepID=A0ABR1BQA1_NECAM